MHGDRSVSRIHILLKVWRYELRWKHQAIGHRLVKTTPINSYNQVGVWKQRVRMFKRLDVFIFGVRHANQSINQSIRRV